MSVPVPHKKASAPTNGDYNNVGVSAYDIILGKVEIDTDYIPQYVYAKQFQTLAVRA